MKRILFFLSVMYFVSASIYSQCRTFAKTMGIEKLDTAVYNHDGRFNSIMLSEGEEIEIFKTVQAGGKYKLVICSDSVFSGVITFTVMDFERNVIYDSKEHENSTFWEFEELLNRRLIITVTIPQDEESIEPKREGCIAIVVGTKK